MKRLSRQLQKLTVVLLILSFVFGFMPATTKKVEAANTKYWIKVNKQANVATAYKLVNGKYKPVKAMLVSCGGSNTPSGTYYTPAKYRWKTLMGPSYGQYSTRITGGILFHSVWYYSHSKASQATKEFNKLGKTASHGCVRLSVADAKWIYDNCPIGTKVTIYSSSNPGALGKPKGIKVSTSRKMYWDPTDPDPKNPYAKKPVISVSSKKAKTVEYGKSYSILSKVTAKDGRTKESLTSKLKYKVTKYSKGKYRSAKFSTKSLGTYKITYSVTSSNKKKTTKTIKVYVVDTLAPVISNAGSYYTHPNGTNAVNKTTAKLRRGTSVTSKMSVYIKTPGAKSYTKYTYATAKTYKFTKAGTYTVKYVAKNTSKPYREASKTVYIYSTKDAEISIDTAKMGIITVGDSVEAAKTAILKGVSIKNYNYLNQVNTVKLDKSMVTFKVGTITEEGQLPFTVSYRGSNGYKVTKSGTVTVKAKATETKTKATTEATTEATTAQP
ncbi:MAG: L,D-transpeptidase [Anaerostipes sp.]|nr:L,D-transpeptidase [Anaerostipes sp.]